MNDQHKIVPVERKILYFVSEDWYFCSHRLELAKAAKKNGYKVIIVTNVDKLGNAIRDEGFELIPLKMIRRGVNPVREIFFIMKLIRIYRNTKPDIVHHVALKPVLVGSIAAYFSKVPFVVNAIAGLGFIYSSKKIIARILRPIIKAAFFLLLNRSNTRVILQNPDDRNILTDTNLVNKNNTTLILGSGVDVHSFNAIPESDGDVLVVLASRMLWNKGIGEFVEAARILKQKNIKAKFILVGDSDPENHASVSNDQLVNWDKEGVIEWWGKQTDMLAVFGKSHIVCLPSYYGEGVPKVLIEAASCARPIVTTDSPGCREIVKHEQNGILVPIRDSTALADALMKLITDKNLRIRYGEKGREIVKSNFTIERVIKQTMAVYDELLP